MRATVNDVPPRRGVLNRHAMSAAHDTPTAPVDDAIPRQAREYLERMALLGTLTSGLGHDLRNLAMPVLLRLDVLALSPGISDAARTDIGAIRAGIEHLHRLANGLRLLSDDGFDATARRRTTDLNGWWRDVRPLVENALDPGTSVVVDMPDSAPRLAVPPGPLAQVIVALATNARRAMSATASRRLTVSATCTASALRLIVSDRGVGMDAATRLRCFEPFFAAYQGHETAGLGLSSGRAMLRHHGGDLLLEEHEGPGVSVVMVIPFASDSGAT